MEVHVLNGDALGDRFPDIFSGEKIIARECLVTGPVEAADWNTFFEERCRFISEAFGVEAADYREKSEAELWKLRELPRDSVVNLWFERDLFCQVNLWAVIHWIKSYTEVEDYRLILPTASLEYGFGGMDEAGLRAAYASRIKLTKGETDQLSNLWSAYQKDDLSTMEDLAKGLASRFPYLPEVVKAHLDRFADENGEGRPERLIRTIMSEKQTTSFVEIFREFHKRAPIYGFGDLQVKQIWEKVLHADEKH